MLGSRKIARPPAWGLDGCRAPPLSGLTLVINPYYVEFRQSSVARAERLACPFQGHLPRLQIPPSIQTVRDALRTPVTKVRVAKRQSIKASRCLLGCPSFCLARTGVRVSVPGWHHVRGAVRWSSIKSAALCSHPEPERQRYCPSLICIRPRAYPSRSTYLLLKVLKGLLSFRYTSSYSSYLDEATRKWRT
jgi:hypothetical protein